MIEGGIKETEEWVVGWRNKGDEGRVGLLLGRSVVGVKKKVLVRIDRIVMGNVLKLVGMDEILIFGT